MFADQVRGFIKGLKNVQEQVSVVCRDNGQGRHDAGIEKYRGRCQVDLACIIHCFRKQIEMCTRGNRRERVR